MTCPNPVTVPTHSAIRIEAGGKVVWFDPFDLQQDYHDADVVFITHSHFDHFSPEDIARVCTTKTVYVMPTSMLDCEGMTCHIRNRTMGVKPGLDTQVKGVDFETVPAYNIGKDFHPQENEWLGYIVTLGGRRYYIAGDTDITPEAQAVQCDVALVPIGGTYTMDATQAAQLTDSIVPTLAIPTHYGSVAGNPEDGAAFAAAVDPDIVVELLLGK